MVLMVTEEKPTLFGIQMAWRVGLRIIVIEMNYLSVFKRVTIFKALFSELDLFCDDIFSLPKASIFVVGLKLIRVRTYQLIT